MIKRVIRQGNSWALTLSKDILAMMGWQKNQKVDMQVIDNDKLLITPISDEIKAPVNLFEGIE